MHLHELKYALLTNPPSAVLGAVTPRLTFVLFGCSLDNNLLCGVNRNGNGTYTTEGIVALMEGVKKSNVQSLR